MNSYAEIAFDMPDGERITLQDLCDDPDIVLQHEQVEQLFRHQCVRCGKLTRVVHELVPRSIAGKKWYYWSNRVVLCPECHDWAHSIGTANSRPILIDLRNKRLEAIYGPNKCSSLSSP